MNHRIFVRDGEFECEAVFDSYASEANYETYRVSPDTVPGEGETVEHTGEYEIAATAEGVAAECYRRVSEARAGRNSVGDEVEGFGEEEAGDE